MKRGYDGNMIIMHATKKLRHLKEESDDECQC